MKRIFIVFALVLLLGLTGCYSDLGVKHCSQSEWLANQIKNPLIDMGMSYRVKNFLTEESLWSEYNTDIDRLLKKLNKRFYEENNQDVLLALIELSYIEAKKYKNIEALYYYMSCAVYCSAYFQETELKPEPSPFSPRFVYVCRFYNYATAEILQILQDEKYNLEKTHDFPIIQGKFVFNKAKNMLPYPFKKYKKFLVCSNFVPYGFLTAARTFGLGVPLIALIDSDFNPKKVEKINKKVYGFLSAPSPATVFLRIKEESGNSFKGTLEFHNPYEETNITIAGKEAPLESDITTVLGYMLQDGPAYSGLKALANPNYMSISEGLYFFTPYDPNKIPLIIVHGLMAQPRTWVQMVNTLLNDKTIREKYQIWFFAYPTGFPVLLSAAKLRKALLNARKALDPLHKNKKFDEAVIIGHSMGGLLSRTMVQSSGDQLVDLLFNKPIDQMKISPETKNMLKSSLIFEPVPYLSRAVFMATPHRGSKLTHSSILKLFINLITLPKGVVRNFKEIAKKAKVNKALLKLLNKDLTEIQGVDSLDPNNVIMSYMVNQPIVVPYHSIIGNNQQADLIGGTDGVVTYRSAHLDGAQSEKVILSGHNVQKTPAGIKEVRRILLLHLKECENREKTLKKNNSVKKVENKKNVCIMCNTKKTKEQKADATNKLVKKCNVKKCDTKKSQIKKSDTENKLLKKSNDKKSEVKKCDAKKTQDKKADAMKKLIIKNNKNVEKKTKCKK